MTAAKKAEPLNDCTCARAGEILGVSASTVRKWIDAGHLPNAWRPPGGHWRVPRGDIAALKEKWRVRT